MMRGRQEMGKGDDDDAAAENRNCERREAARRKLIFPPLFPQYWGGEGETIMAPMMTSLSIALPT